MIEKIIERNVWDVLSETELPIILYGMGNGADMVIDELHRRNLEFKDIFAGDAFVRGQIFHGKRVKKYSEICEEYENFFIVMCFAVHDDETIEKIIKMAEEHPFVAPNVPIVDDGIFTREFIEEHDEEFDKAYNLLADDESKKNYISILNFKVSGKIQYLFEAEKNKEFVYDKIFNLSDNEILVDLGAYDGDTIKEFTDFTNGKYDKIFAVELGLSSDTFLADTIGELEGKTFVTNSDAHSLPRIAREYNKMQVEDISFKEIVKALKGEDGRKVIANYGLDPKLGKYHRSFCEDCNDSIEIDEAATVCPKCNGSNITFGVFDRIELIKDKKETISPEHRPEYVYQVPLSFIPGVGGKTIDKLINHFETEMNILHKAGKDDIEAVVGEKVASAIVNAREGKAKVHSGGGGVYGKVTV